MGKGQFMERTTNRWVLAAFGAVVLLFAGLVYAWSVLSVPLAAEFSDASQAEVSLAFTVCMIFFCLGGFVGGLVSKRVSVRVNMGVASVLFAAGFVLAARSSALAGVYAGYGVLAGSASGLAYNAVMSTIARWFPDKQGTVSGVLLMGFGLGSFIIGKVYQAATPAELGGWRTSFTVMAVVLFCVMALGALVFKAPPAGFVPPATASARVQVGAPRAGAGLELNAARMVRRPSFILFFIWAVLLSTVGLAVIAQGAGIVGQVGAGLIDGGTTATIVGLISIFNGVGRVVFGSLFDRVGQRPTMMLVTGAYLVSTLVVIAAVLTQSIPVLVAGFIGFGLSYGGVPPTNAAFVNAFYGSEHYAVNFSIVNLNIIVASFGGTLAGMLFDVTGSYFSTFIAAVALTLVAGMVALLIRKP